jgi:hypothetical protein
MAPLYSFDSSAFIQPHRRYYPFDVFPSFWRHLERLIAEGSILATEIVRDELEQKDDELTAWAKNQNGLFVPVDQEQQLAVTAIVNRFPKWVDADSSKNQCDPFVVALAMCTNLTVVSDEIRPRRPPPRSPAPHPCSPLSNSAVASRRAQPQSPPGRRVARGSYVIPSATTQGSCWLRHRASADETARRPEERHLATVEAVTV